MTSHYLNQCWHHSPTHYAALGGDEIMLYSISSQALFRLLLEPMLAKTYYATSLVANMALLQLTFVAFCWNHFVYMPDTVKLTGPRTFADEKWVGPVKLLCIIMFKISNISSKSLLGLVKAQKFLRCLCMHPANDRWCYNVTSSLIGWAHTQNDPCYYARVLCPIFWFQLLFHPELSVSDWWSLWVKT